MKFIKTLPVVLSTLIFSGAIYAGESSALMKALTSPEAGMYAGGAYLLKAFVQPRDGASFVRNVEALNTVYFEKNTQIKVDSDSVIIVFQMDKSGKQLELLSYDHFVDFPEGTVVFDPLELPDIDFQWAWREVKKGASMEYGAPEKDWVLASVAISKTLVPDTPLIIAFRFKPVWQDTEYCWTWDYDYDAGTIHESPLPVSYCWYQY